ncbi:MAG TPA: GNAT family N-acetyltransferase, partial [Opitutaceae bacterium]|nr:GNAT family N-acetyltransferase [Opitutaceae bacterium]
MQIREITPDDRVGIAGVFQRAFAAAPWKEVWSDDSALALIDEWLLLPRFFGLVAVSEGTIVGMVFGRFEAWDRKGLFYMKELCVAPEYQRSGVGAQLNQALE